MPNDDRPSSDKSTKAAQQNKISHRDRKYPWHLPYLRPASSRTVAQAYGSAYPAKNMLENQLAALACEDWGDFRS